MTYAESMARFGSDKPDLRMGQELVECTDYFKDTPFRVFQAPYVGAVVMPGGASQPRKQLDAWQEWAKQRGARGLAYVLVQEDGELGGPVAKNLSEEEKAGLAAHVGASPGDCIFFAAGPVKSSRALLGAARLEIGRRGGLIDEDAWSFLWVVDAPLFEPADEATAAGDVAVGSGAWTAVHHAFTSPQDLDAFDKDPGDALAWAYDIVCNGNEIGGGSIRIHREDVQKRVFAIMGIDEEEAQEKFGFLLEAFKYGAPPHGGIAFGWDRIVALLAGTDSIRDVIAFPKSGGGFDPLTAAPAPITPSSARRPASTPSPHRRRRRAARPTAEAGRRSGRGRRPRKVTIRAVRWYQTVTSRCPDPGRRSLRVGFARDVRPVRCAPSVTNRRDFDAPERSCMAGIAQQPMVSTSEEVPPEGSPEQKEIAGRSPMRIAFDRLRQDKIAVICFAVVVLFALIAIFAGVICRHLRCVHRVGAGQRPDRPRHRHAAERPAQPRLRPRAPVRPGPQVRQRPPGLLALRLPHLADHRQRRHALRRRRRHRARPGRGLRGRRLGPGHPVRHRPVPDDPVPAGRAGHRPDPLRPVRRQPRPLHDGRASTA